MTEKLKDILRNAKPQTPILMGNPAGKWYFNTKQTFIPKLNTHNITKTIPNQSNFQNNFNKNLEIQPNPTIDLFEKILPNLPKVPTVSQGYFDMAQGYHPTGIVPYFKPQDNFDFLHKKLIQNYPEDTWKNLVMIAFHFSKSYYFNVAGNNLIGSIPIPSNDGKNIEFCVISYNKLYQGYKLNILADHLTYAGEFDYRYSNEVNIMAFKITKLMQHVVKNKFEFHKKLFNGDEAKAIYYTKLMLLQMQNEVLDYVEYYSNFLNNYNIPEDLIKTKLKTNFVMTISNQQNNNQINLTNESPLFLNKNLTYIQTCNILTELFEPKTPIIKKITFSHGIHPEKSLFLKLINQPISPFDEEIHPMQSGKVVKGMWEH